MDEDIDKTKIKHKAGKNFSHDNVFHTILDFMEASTSIYDMSLDILAGTEKNKSDKHGVLAQER